MKNDGPLFLMGVFIGIFICFLSLKLFHERACEKAFDVFDCQMEFTPTPQGG